MAQKKIGVGLIGCQPGRSWSALAHIPALGLLKDDFTIAAVSTTRQESADAAAKHYDIPRAFDSAAALSACDEVDLVVVTVKAPEHLTLVKTAIDAGKHVYCEWPLGNGLPEARRMAEMVKTSDRVMVAGTQALFSPAVAYVRDLVREGHVGRVLSSSVIGSGAAWGAMTDGPNAYTADLANGATLLTIPVGHTMEGVCSALGQVKSLTARLGRARDKIKLIETGEMLPLTAHDQVMIAAELESGAFLNLHYRGGASRGVNFLWEINGEDGDLVIEAGMGHLQMFDAAVKGARGTDAALQPLPIPDAYNQGFGSAPWIVSNVARAYKAVAADIRTGSRTAPSFETALRRHQMIAAVETAAAQAAPVSPLAM